MMKLCTGECPDSTPKIGKQSHQRLNQEKLNLLISKILVDGTVVIFVLNSTTKQENWELHSIYDGSRIWKENVSFGWEFFNEGWKLAS